MFGGSRQMQRNRRDMHPLKRFLLRNGDWTSNKKMSEELQFHRNHITRICNLQTLIDFPTAMALEEYSKGELGWKDLMEYQGKAWLAQAAEDADRSQPMSVRTRWEFLRHYILEKRAQRGDKMARLSGRFSDHTDYNTIKRF